eukprot:5374280-Karenia_brevis.AAC.1
MPELSIEVIQQNRAEHAKIVSTNRRLGRGAKAAHLPVRKVFGPIIKPADREVVESIGDENCVAPPVAPVDDASTPCMETFNTTLKT